MSNSVEELNYSGAQCVTKAPYAEERSLNLGLKGDGRGFSNTFHLVGSRGLCYISFQCLTIA